MKAIIDAGLFSQGSFGLLKYDPRTGVRKGEVIRVWVATFDGKKARFTTRQKARNWLWKQQREALFGPDEELTRPDAGA